jgi:hypothetical protein
MAAVDPIDRAVAVALVAMQPPHDIPQKVVEPHSLIEPRNDCAALAVYSFHMVILESTSNTRIEDLIPSDEFELLTRKAASGHSAA